MHVECANAVGIKMQHIEKHLWYILYDKRLADCLVPNRGEGSIRPTG